MTCRLTHLLQTTGTVSVRGMLLLVRNQTSNDVNPNILFDFVKGVILLQQKNKTKPSCSSEIISITCPGSRRGLCLQGTHRSAGTNQECVKAGLMFTPRPIGVCLWNPEDTAQSMATAWYGNMLHKSRKTTTAKSRKDHEVYLVAVRSRFDFLDGTVRCKRVLQFSSTVRAVEMGGFRGGPVWLVGRDHAEPVSAPMRLVTSRGHSPNRPPPHIASTSSQYTTEHTMPCFILSPTSADTYKVISPTLALHPLYMSIERPQNWAISIDTGFTRKKCRHVPLSLTSTSYSITYH